MKTLIAALLLCLTSFAHAFETKDAEMLAGAIIIAGDWATTRDMSKRYNEGFYEKGLVLSSIYGKHPSSSQVDLYFAARLLVHYAVHKSSLSDDTKRIYYYITIADHGSALKNNLSIGLKVRF